MENVAYSDSMNLPKSSLPIRNAIAGAVALVLMMAGFLAGAHAIEPAERGPSFVLPVACTPNRDCWVVNYMDHQPGQGVTDYQCRARSYEGHNGTDFGLQDMARLAEGVQVLAAAKGTVIALRDGMDDISIAITGEEAVSGRECGNGLTINHGDGWITQYCHLKNGSLTVKKGQQVQAGQALGLVGLSGQTEFPHLHFTVRHLGNPMDPFTGTGLDGPCFGQLKPLWHPDVTAQLPYRPVIIYNMGVSDEPPTMVGAREGLYRATQLPAGSALLALWVNILGVEAGDHLTLRIRNPQGKTVAQHQWELNRRQAAYFSFVGQRRDSGWPSGMYRGEAVLHRPDGDLTETRTLLFDVLPSTSSPVGRSTTK